MTTVDTSAEAVERLAHRLRDDADSPEAARYLPYTDTGARLAAATLRALAAERDALNAGVAPASPATADVPAPPFPATVTLRDYFATRHRFDSEGLSVWKAQAVMGQEAPWHDAADPMPWFQWWATAEARVRYAMADAMLKARQEGKTDG